MSKVRVGLVYKKSIYDDLIRDDNISSFLYF